MIYILLTCAAIIGIVVLIKKYILKIDYSEYSKENNRLQKMIKTETLKDEKENE